MKKRSVKILSLVLSLLMMLSLVPMEAFATGGNQWGWGSGSQGPEMPAQQLKATDSQTGVSIAVNAPEGALPQGTTLSVKGVSLPAVQTIVDKSADINCTVVAAEDITFYYQGSEIEPEKNVSVTLASDAIANTLNPTVLHLDCSAEEIESGSVPVEVMGSGTSFSSKDFSVYVVGDNTNTINLLTVEFYNADGSEIISSQSIRLDQLDQYIANDMDFVHDPGVPEITATQSFEGWADKTPYTEEDTGWSVADINDKIEAEKATLAASTTDLTWKYYAKVYDVVFVTFHDQDGVVIRLESIHLDNGHGDYEVNLSYTPFKSGWAHVGWTPVINNTGDEPTYPDSPVVYENGDTIDLTASIDLYPYLKEGYWLIFDNYIEQDDDTTSASFTSPRYYGKDESAALPTDYGDANNDGVDHDTEPYRVGYSFGGWYTDKRFTTPYTARQLTADTTVYAKWTPRTDTKYTVVIWTQRADDVVDNDNLNNEYDFYDSIDTRKGTTGELANYLTGDTTLGGTTGSILGFYYTFNEARSDSDGVKIKGDGTTVVNVYYDRKVITFNFYGDLTTGETASSSSNSYSSYINHYGRIGSSGNYSYVLLYTDASIKTNGDYSGTPSWYYYNSSGTRTTYSGTIYHCTYNSSSTSTGSAEIYFGSIQGLWFDTMESFNWTGEAISGREWPYPGTRQMWHNGYDGRYQSKAFQFETGTRNVTEVNYFLNTYAVSGTTRPYSCIGQDSSGNYTITIDEDALKSGEIVYFSGTEYYGYRLSRYNLTANNYNTATPWDGNELSIDYDDIGSNGHAYFFYSRNQWKLDFFSNGSSLTASDLYSTGKDLEHVYFDQSLSGFKPTKDPTNGPVGYYFDGWYKDPGCTEEFDWTDDMPNNNVAVYAKWTLMRFRVTLDYTGGHSDAQVEFPANQASTFRVDYGEKVRDTAIIAATREGYTLLGWYLDPQGNHPFNFAEAITDQTYNMDLTYTYGTGRTGTDAVTGNPYNDDQLNDDGTPKYANVVGKVTIYALWRQNPIGSDGVRVRYDAIEGDGYFAPQTDPRVIIRDDPNVYTDHARAFTQVASTPEDQDNYRFLYWVVMQPVKDASGNVVMENGEPKLEQTTIKVYPGQTFIVDYDYTVQLEAVKVKWIFKDADGDENLTDTTTVTKGAEPQHSKPSGYVSGSSYYPVVGWTDGTETYYYDGENHTGTNVELPAVNENTTFTAVYGEPEEVSQHQFTVTWKNWDGTVLATQTYTAGQTPSYPNGTPTRPADSDYTYTFSGWTPAITVVSGDTTYTATYTAADRTFTVTFHANGGTIGSADTTTVSNVTKGTLFRDIFPTTDPTHSSYTFLGWFTAATGGTEVTGTTEFDGTVLDLYAHYYAYYAVQDTSGTFIDGDVYMFRFTVGSSNYYLNATSSTGRLNGTNTSPIPVTAQWTAHASSSTGFYFENLNYSGSYIYDYTSDTDYAALSTTSYWRMLLAAGSTSGTFYFYTPGNSNDYYMYYGSSSYSSTRYFQWSTSYATAFTVMHREKRDMNADSGTGGAGSSGTMAVVSPESPAVVQRAVFGEVKSEPNSSGPSATRGNTTPVKATTDKYEQITVGTTGLSAGKYLLTYTNTSNIVCVVTPPEMYDGNNYVACSSSGNDPTASGSYYTFSKDMSSYLFTITGDVSSWKNENGTYLATGSSATYTTYSATPETWTWNGYRLTNSNNYSLDCYSVNLRLASSSNDTYTLYKLVEDGGEEPTTTDLDEALNVEGGNLHFTTGTTHPWTVPSGQSYAQSGNAGVNSSTSDLYLTLEMQAGDKISFKYFGYGEKSSYNSTYYDYLNFLVNGTENSDFGKVCESTGFETFTFTAPSAGTYSFTWRFTKDSSTSNSPDCGRIDDVTFTPSTPSYTITWNYKDASGADASTTSTVLEGNTPTAPTVPETYTLNGTTYHFTGWDKTIVAATEATTYTAQYEVQSYTITWSYKDSTGANTSITTEVAPNAIPAPGFTPASYTSGGDEYRFTGWTPAIAAATGPATYTAQYTNVSYTITWHIKTDGGTWTTVTTRVAEGAVPTYSSHPVWEDGNGDEWMFSGWAASENGEIAAPVAATSDADYWAQYTKVGVYTYTMYLHAVYGPYNKSGTHITWFGNNDPTGETAGVSVERDKGLTINFGYDIPTPTTFFNGTKDHYENINLNPTTNLGLTYADHVFLGWARLEADPNDTAGKGTAHPELGEDDLYLKWTGTGYEYKNGDNWVSAAKIAADEMSPYHDMYAVWAKVFYVCHSGTGTIERHVWSATEMKDVNGTEKRVDKSFDLTANLTANTLYGGYYKAYSTYTEKLGSTLTWTTPASAAELNATGSAVVTMDNAVTKYDAAKVNPGVTWQWANAYKADDGAAPGDAIVPVAGQTYYIKEVPTSYLQHYTHYTYKFGTTNGTNNLITKLWMVTDVDDNNYQHVGIKYLTADNEAKVVKSLKISTSTQPVASVTLTPTSIFGSKGVEKGYLAYTAIEWPNVDGNKIDNILNFWVTPDNMMVTGTAQRGLVDIQSADTIHIETLTTVDSTITPYTDPTNP